MIAISIANSVGSRRSSAPVVVVPVATAATGVGETSFTANWNAFAGANYYLLDVSLNSSFSSFVGSYQNYVTIGTSQLVSGLTPNTTYYYRLRAVTGVDSDAAAFFSRVYTAGGVLSYTEVTATETLVYDMKTAGLWTAMKAVYPMVGASAAACAQNLKSSSFTGSFSSGWTFASTGATPNGTSAYMDSGLNATSNLTRSNHHISFYSRTQDSSGNYWNIGGEIAPAISNLGVYFNAVSNKVFLSGSYPTYAAQSNVTNTLGLHIGSHTSSTSQKLYQNTSLLATNTNSNTLAMPNLNYWIGAANNNGVIGLPAPHQCAFASIGDGLTDTQASNFYTAVQTFNQTLNRQVGAQIVSDADAQAYINRVYTAGGTLTNTEANAVNQLVIDMKGAGIWTSMKAVYPMVGASAAACAQNLKSSSFTGTFSSGWTFASTGVTPNGTSAYMDTGFNPITQLSSNSNFHLSNYSPIHSTGTSRTYIGSTSGASGTFNATSIGLYTGGSIEVGQVSSSTFAEYGGQIAAFGGMQNVSVNGSRVNKYYKNGVLSGVQTTGTGVFDNINIYLAASVISGSLGLYDDKEHRFNSIGDGLTDTQASDFYNAVQIFNTTLGRQVAG